MHGVPPTPAPSLASIGMVSRSTLDTIQLPIAFGPRSMSRAVEVGEAKRKRWRWLAVLPLLLLVVFSISQQRVAPVTPSLLLLKAAAEADTMAQFIAEHAPSATRNATDGLTTTHRHWAMEEACNKGVCSEESVEMVVGEKEESLSSKGPLALSFFEWPRAFAKDVLFA